MARGWFATFRTSRGFALVAANWATAISTRWYSYCKRSVARNTCAARPTCHSPESMVAVAEQLEQSFCPRSSSSSTLHAHRCEGRLSLGSPHSECVVKRHRGGPRQLEFFLDALSPLSLKSGSDFEIGMYGYEVQSAVGEEWRIFAYAENLRLFLSKIDTQNTKKPIFLKR